ncbi:MAG: 16S rRNA (adenine(1518)-N(6)/adenine(1519)-N(6))-dimethyltransferase RsmA [Gammaproteobacteria bacterium]|nr:16S rRNA (adenine(1518)-N(6)/adenine(1519)-N(6))-dimethyltransferase RsmA [Gammaproteobacteria bacterium]
MAAPLPPPRKRYGQHFLHDPAIIARIVEAIDPRPGRRLVEIGPGRGALTAPLVEAAGELDVVEIDRELAAMLPTRLGATPQRLRIHCQDVLDFRLEVLGTSPSGYDVVGNLPYNISTPLIFHLLEQADLIRTMVFMLQKEVADRMAAPPGNKQYGRLSVMVQYHCLVDRLFSIGPGAFTPPPRVASTVIRLTPRKPPAGELARNAAGFSAVVARAFSTRRKTLRNALRGFCNTEHILEAGIDPGARAEALSVADFVRLSNAIATARCRVM